MLYQVGGLTLDTFPFEVGAADRETTADFAKHALVSAPLDYEFGGPGVASLNLSGTLLPFHIGGLSELEYAHSMCEAGDAQWVMRGDGRVFGWYVPISVKDKQKHLSPTGVGFVVEYEIRLERVGDPGASRGSDLIAAILSLFG